MAGVGIKILVGDHTRSKKTGKRKKRRTKARRRIKKRRKRAMVQKTKRGGTGGKRTRGGSAGGIKTKGGSAKGRKTKRESVGSRRTKGGSTRSKMTKGRSAGGRKTKERRAGGGKNGILVIIILVAISVIGIILVCLSTSFRFDSSFLTLLFPLQSSLFFPRILFTLVILVRSNSSLDFAPFIQVKTGKPWTEFPFCVKIGIRGTIF